MEYDWLFHNLDAVLLAVVLAPLVLAGLSLAAGTGGFAAARRTAAYLAAGHLLLTLVLVGIAGSILADPGRGDGSTNSRFNPLGVPGDRGTAAGGFTHRTAWTLMSFAAPAGPDRGAAASDVQFFLGVDGLNLFLLPLTSLMTFLAVLVSWEGITEKAGAFYAWIFVLEAACLGAFAAQDVILFYVFFELTLIPAFFLIGKWGVGGARRDAAKKFFLYTLFGSLITLVGIAAAVWTTPTPILPMKDAVIPVTQAAFKMPGTAEPQTPVRGPITFSLPQLTANRKIWDDVAAWRVTHEENRAATAPAAQKAEAQKAAAAAVAERDRQVSVQTLIFFALLAGFAVKVPLVPFHTWLPAAYGEAPLGVTMLLSAVLAKLGTYGMLKIVIPLAPAAALEYGLAGVGVLGCIGIVYAALCAVASKDLKMLAAYSSVSHLGFLVLGLFSLTPEGVAGAILHMVNHGLTAGALFALLAFLADRYKTTDAGKFGGLFQKYPGYGVFFVVLTLAAVGLPGLNSFVSEMLMMAGLFDPRNAKLAGYGAAATAAFGLFLGAWYSFTAIKKVFFGPLVEPPAVAATGGLTGREATTFATLTACCLLLGLMPQGFLDAVKADATRVAGLTDNSRGRRDDALAAVPPLKQPAEGTRK